ncbi:P-loop containing nucleoside triphosphate hydrolase protein [Phlyctochytrium arcticum]|nr:P-loop containing nucleoside triphosphate hydrolase protein [Phlyctochytrium arcticum]
MAQGCHVLIATPGHLLDMIQSGNISLEHCHYLVVDEADRLVNMGFGVDVRHIISAFNMPADHQTAMFSATFPRDKEMMAAEVLIDHVSLTVNDNHNSWNVPLRGN